MLAVGRHLEHSGIFSSVFAGWEGVEGFPAYGGIKNSSCDAAKGRKYPHLWFEGAFLLPLNWGGLRRDTGRRQANFLRSCGETLR